MNLLYFALLFFITTTNAERPTNEIPMYGGEDKSHVKRDEKSSRSVSKLGWEYYYKNDLDTAIKRFNQAWMFDRENAEAYWGFGLIMGRRAGEGETEKNLRESIRFLEMAHKYDSKNGRIIGDLAFSHTLLAKYLTKQNQDGAGDYSRAETLFKEAHELDPKYPPIAYNWSVLKFYMGDFKSAGKLLDEAKALGYKPDPAYVKDLEQKLK